MWMPCLGMGADSLITLRGDAADMTSHRATLTVPAGASRREADVDQEPRSPSLLVEPHGGHRPTPPERAPEAGATISNIDVSLVVAARGYMAPALQAAGAARARTARIRAAASAAAAGAPRPDTHEWLMPAPDHLFLDPSAPSEIAPPIRSRPPELAEAPATWTIRGKSVAGAAGLSPALPPGAAAPASRGLSVAEAARASRIAFRPLRPEASAHPAAPGSTTPPPAATPLPTAPGKAGAPGRAAAWPETDASPTEAGSPDEPDRPLVPERAFREQRFAKTLADLQRHHAATRPDEPWGKVVPRPAVPQSNPATTESRWSRLWSRR
jgi:hypothetical protein